MLAINNLSLAVTTGNYSKTILNNVSCSIPTGRITTFVGKSGAGKTSLLRCIAGLVTNYSGEILLNNQNLAKIELKERAALVGFVAQNYNLFPHMTVLANCMQPLMVTQGMAAAAAESKARALLKTFGLADLAEQYPSQISGGQKQRVAITRALLLGPQVLLLDEPTSALDPENSALLAELLKQLVADGITVVISSQDMSFVRMIMDCVYLMQDGQLVDCFDRSTDCALGNELEKFIS